MTVEKVIVPIELDVRKTSSTLDRPVTVHLRQGEGGTTVIRAAIVSDGSDFDLTGYSASFCAVMPGNLTVMSESCEIYGNTMDFEVPGVIIGAKGRTDGAYFELEAHDADGTRRVLTTIGFSIVVNEGVDITPAQYNAYIPRVTRLVDEASGAVQAAVTASRVAQADLQQWQAEAGEVLDEASEAEQLRDTAEELRIMAEDARIANEAARDDAEAERQAAEEDRVIAELERDEAEAYRQASFADMEQRSRGWLRYICQEGDFDPDTGFPTVEEPDAGTMYFVPSGVATDQSAYQEWIWVSSPDGDGGSWESFGEVELTITPVSPDQIEAVVDGTDDNQGGGELLNLTGLRLLWARIVAKFAGIIHTHSADDIDSGTLDIDRIADGSIPSSKLDQTTRDSLSRFSTDAHTSNVAIWADETGYIAIMVSRKDGSLFRANIMADGRILWTEA